MQVTAVADFGTHADRHGTFHRVDHHHFAGIQDSEIDRLPADFHEALHHRLGGTMEYLLKRLLALQIEELLSHPITAIAGAVEIAAAFESGEDAVYRGFRELHFAREIGQLVSRFRVLDFFKNV